MAFEVAPVKLMKPGSRGHAPNFPLDNGDAFTNLPSGESAHGRFSATIPVPLFIVFAYKLSLTPDLRRSMSAPLPKWVDTD